MIYLAISPAGLNEILKTATPDDVIWCGSDAISEEAYAALSTRNLSRFIYALSDRTLLDDALQTIEEHHPDQFIWVEAAPSA